MRGQHSARQAPPHRLSTPTNPHKPKRQVLLLIPMDKHIWQPGSTGVHCDSHNQPLDIQCADFLFSHSNGRDRREESERKREREREGCGGYSTRNQILISPITGISLYNCSVTLISSQSKSLN